MTIEFKSTFVRREPSQIVEALVGLKDVQVLAYRRVGPDVELVIEQSTVQRMCPACGGCGQIKERPTVRYVDLPVYGQPMRLAWRKHRFICRRQDCPGGSWTSADHRIAAKNAYQKNDQAHVESKNNHVVRKHAFYWRYDTGQELELLNRLWKLVSLRLRACHSICVSPRWSIIGPPLGRTEGVFCDQDHEGVG